jgi:hypothetical protein
MTNTPDPPESKEQTGSVTIGDVFGGIWNSIIAGGNVIVQTFTGSGERCAQRNRRAMLELVRNTWIKGVLEQSLHGAVMIELGLEERPGAVENPWDMVLQTEKERRPLPSGTRITDVFDEMNGALLILGEPGSGKTTMLLELARDTIARAEEDPTQLIPVVFNLSSWAEKRQPIADWLVDELNTKYSVPKKTARAWVENDELLLLLDGLDEVRLECRAACAKAINDFRQEHGLTSLVVCSRVADYEALTTRLRLQGAVLLQALTLQQIDQYLERLGVGFLAVRRTLQHAPTLQELAQTPLMLSVITLAYRRMSVEELGSLDSAEAGCKHVFDTYVQQMFERRRTDQPYSRKQTIQRLAWLAQKMIQHTQTVFLIERIRPNWLEGARRPLYALFLNLPIQLSLALPAGLIVGLVSALIGGLAVGGIGGLAGLLVSSLILALIAGRRSRGAMPLTPTEVKWSWKGAGKGLIVGLVFGLTLWLILILIRVPDFDVNVVLSEFQSVLLGFGRTGAVLSALASGLVGVLFGGLTQEAMQVKTDRSPSQGIRIPAENAAIVGAISSLIMGLVFGLAPALTLGPVPGLKFGLIVGPVFGLAFGVILGGGFVLQHLTLRFILHRNGYIPWNLIRFLDYATERIFLRKVGGGYIFIHRLLQEYFASLYQEKSAVVARNRRLR